MPTYNPDDRVLDFECSPTFRRYEDELLEVESPPLQSISQEIQEAQRIREVRNRRFKASLTKSNKVDSLLDIMRSIL